MFARRLIAFLVLLVTTGWMYEPTVGALRDGAVHHESAVAATEHAEQATGDHGHEDTGVLSSDHGGTHQHGTAADHCTHQHAPAAPAVLPMLAAAPADSILPIGFRSTAPSVDPTSFFRPPQS